jgi:hypothetical protein
VDIIHLLRPSSGVRLSRIVDDTYSNLLKFNRGSATGATSGMPGDSGASYILRDSYESDRYNWPIIGIHHAGVGDYANGFCRAFSEATNVSAFRPWAQNRLASWGTDYYSPLGLVFDQMFLTKIQSGVGTANWVPGPLVGVTQTASISDYAAAIAPSLTFGDGIIFTHASSSSDTDWQGLVGHYRDQNNFYVFEVSERYDTARLRRIKYGTSTILQSVNMTEKYLFNFDWSYSHAIYMVFSDTLVVGIVDGVWLISYDDAGADAITVGHPGLWNSQQTDAYYGDFQLMQ